MIRLEINNRLYEGDKIMTVKECYEQMGADYEGVLGRLRSEALIKKFAKKFLDDGSYASLKKSLEERRGSLSCCTYIERRMPESWI